MEEPEEKGNEASKRYTGSEKGKIAVEKYQKSDKGKKARKKYLDSEKGKISSLKYRTSEKGKKQLEKSQNIRKLMATYQTYLKTHKGATFEDFILSLSPPCFFIPLDKEGNIRYVLCSESQISSYSCFHRNDCPGYKET